MIAIYENNLTESAYKSCCLLEEDQIKTFNTILTVLEPAAAARYRTETGQTSTADLLAKYDKDIFEHMVARAKILPTMETILSFLSVLRVPWCPLFGTCLEQLFYYMELRAIFASVQQHRCKNSIFENTKYCRLRRNKLYLNSNKNTEISSQIGMFNFILGVLSGQLILGCLDNLSTILQKYVQLLKDNKLHRWSLKHCVRYLDGAIGWFSAVTLAKFHYLRFLSDPSTVTVHDNKHSLELPPYHQEWRPQEAWQIIWTSESMSNQ